MNLKDTRLFKQQCYVNGEWIDADNKAIVSVQNPATGKELGTVPALSQKQVSVVIAEAEKAWKAWREMTANARAAILRKWNDLIEENVNDLAMILTLEQGKPLSESRGEIALGASYIPWYAEEGRRAYGDTMPCSRAGVRPITVKQSIGVSAAITPWNFPMSMITRKAAPSLAAGCPIIIKPASQTPFSALALAELAHRAGFPAGVFNVITGNSGVIGNEICTNPLVRKLSFTGSTEVGKKLVAQCAVTMKKVSMELGGNAPFIVFDDADVTLAAESCMASKFRNAGQTCICADRFLIHSQVHDEFVQQVASAVQKVKLGSGIEENVTQGPMIDAKAVENLESLVKDAQEKGAKILCGGKRHALGGLFFEPTLIIDVTPQMRVWHEEIFGPIAAIMKFTDENEAIRIANNTPYGLAGYFFTNNLSRSIRVAEALEFGILGCNEVGLSSAEVPFGGIKESGNGREGGHEGLEDFMETKYLLIGNI